MVFELNQLSRLYRGKPLALLPTLRLNTMPCFCLPNLLTIEGTDEEQAFLFIYLLTCKVSLVRPLKLKEVANAVLRFLVDKVLRMRERRVLGIWHADGCALRYNDILAINVDGDVLRRV